MEQQYTAEDIRDILEAVISSRTWNVLSEVGADLEIRVGSDLVPELVFTSPDDRFRIRFNTVELVREDGEVGHEFRPTIVNASLNQDDAYEAAHKFALWSTMADVAQQIYEIDFYPTDYEID